MSPRRYVVVLACEIIWIVLMSIASKFIKSMEETGFVDTITELGFTLEKDDLIFYRKRNDFIDCISLQPLAAGKGVRLGVSVVRLEMYPEHEKTDFPRNFTKRFRNISNKYISSRGVGYSTGNWDTSGVGRFQKTFDEISSLLITDVLPWFNAIDTNRTLYESIFEDSRENGKYDFLLDE